MMQEVYYPGNVIAACGYLGSGKTMLGVRLLFRLRLRRFRCIANIETVFAERAVVLEDFTEARQTAILWDEIQESLDSREFKHNIAATRDAIFLRKRGNILIYTVPAIDMVDKRIRQLTNYLYAAQFIRPGLSVVTRYVMSPTGQIRPRGVFSLNHSLWGKLYNSWDEDVLLLPRANPAPRQRSQRGRVSAGDLVVEGTFRDSEEGG
jgi:hypothetical protein